VVKRLIFVDKDLVFGKKKKYKIKELAIVVPVVVFSKQKLKDLWVL
jgi:hypothetical protein